MILTKITVIFLLQIDTIKNKAEKWGIYEQKRVYVVQSSHGQYEDHITEINGIYSRPDVAEVEAQKIRDYYREIVDGGYPSDKVDDWSIISKEDKERLFDLDDKYNYALEYNRTWVTEFELDK